MNTPNEQQGSHLDYAYRVKQLLIAAGSKDNFNKEDGEFIVFCYKSEEPIPVQVCADAILDYRTNGSKELAGIEGNKYEILRQSGMLGGDDE